LTGPDTKKSVLIVGNDDRVAARVVQTGLEDPNSVEIISGLKEGDRVIVANIGSYEVGEIVDPRQSSFTLANAKDGDQ
jgi:hypothetical protein